VNVTRRTRYVRIPVFTAETGYSEQAVREKIREGKWIEGQHYRRAPDGHILIDLEAYERWVESPRAAA
jgi:hypothetical protein